MKTKAAKKFVHHLLLEVRNQEINEGLLDTVKGFFGGKSNPSAAPEKPETPDEKKARIAYLAQELEKDSNAQANDAAEMFQVAAGRLAIKPSGDRNQDIFTRYLNDEALWTKLGEMNDKYGKLFRYVFEEALEIIVQLKMFTAISNLRPNSEEYNEYKSEADKVAELLSVVGITPMTKYTYNEKTYPIAPISNFFYAKKFILAASTALPEPKVLVEDKVFTDFGSYKRQSKLHKKVDITFNTPGNNIFYALATQDNPLKHFGKESFRFYYILSWFTNYNETGQISEALPSVAYMKADVDPKLAALSSVKIVENVNYVNVSRLQKLAGILKD